jgi:Rad3-related DNA helicase
MKCPQTGKVFAEIKPSIIKELPIREILPSDDFNKNIHDKVIQLVDNILISNVDYKTEMKDADRKILQQKIDAIDKQIDRLVYELYGLSEDEIKIVEGAG